MLRPLRRQLEEGPPLVLSSASSPSLSPSSASSQSTSSSSSDTSSSSTTDTSSTESSSTPTSTSTSTSESQSSSSSSSSVSSDSSSSTSSTSTTSTTTTPATPSATPPPTPSANAASTSFVIQLKSPTSSESYHSTPSLSLASSTPGPGSLSGGATIGICVLAALAGFAVLFWIGVKVAQMKRRKQENDEIDRIDFDPANGSTDGEYYSAGYPLARSKASDDMRNHNVDYLGGAGQRDLAEVAYEDEQERKEREQIYDDYMHSMAAPGPRVTDASSMHSTGSGGNRAGVGVPGSDKNMLGHAYASSMSRQSTSGRFDKYENSYAAAAANPIMYGGKSTQYGFNNDYNNPFAGPAYAPAPELANGPYMRQVNQYAGSDTRSLTPDPFYNPEPSTRRLQRTDSVGTAKEDVGNGVGRLMLVQH